jgi:hypothetical protein
MPDKEDPDQAHMWAIFSDKAGPALLTVYKNAIFFLETAPFYIFHTTVLEGFDQSKRLVEMLGFKRSNTFTAIDGKKHSWYSRARGGKK